MKLCLLALPLASAFMVPTAPMHRVAPAVRTAPLAKMSLVSSLKDSVVPANVDQTSSNVVGLQMVGWGIGAIFIPKLMLETLFACSISGATVPLMRGMGLGMLTGGIRNCNGGDAAAAMDGVIFYGMWTYLLKGALAAGTFGGYTSMIITWNALVALSCARRMGGIWSTATKLDTSTLSSLLPRDNKLSLRNVVGAQLLGWALICTFFQPFFFGPLLLNIGAVGKGAAAAAHAAQLAITASGIGVANFIIAGRNFGGSDADAAANGAVIFGGYGIISLIAKNAGLFTGSLMTACSLWNLAVAAYCVKEMLD